jgi:lipopolysaccharide export system protein LptA
MQRRALHALLVAGFVAAAMAGSVAAQQKPAQGPQLGQPQPQGPQNALQGFSQNRDQPVKIQAASLEVRDKDKVATFSGDVHVTNGDTEMRCKSLRVFYEDDSNATATANANPNASPKNTMKAADPGPNGSRQISRIEAKGGVVVVQKDQHATGESALFNMRENTVTLTGNVVVVKGQDVLRGQKLVVDLTSGVSKIDRAEAVIIPRGNPAEKK